ncbi:hypothetical protein HAX54_045864 [Datura stramonium]|uniref:Uncharacterized protein n=1 Tax=Datura stramonium TaxID=4076 RepID=A0ABS8SR66_DATST|nr:hypothetical protein [Datura stramonium]
MANLASGQPLEEAVQPALFNIPPSATLSFADRLRLVATMPLQADPSKPDNFDSHDEQECRALNPELNKQYRAQLDKQLPDLKGTENAATQIRTLTSSKVVGNMQKR